jgi:hypothetical protein
LTRVWNSFAKLPKGFTRIVSAPAELVLHALGLSMTDGRSFDADTTLVPKRALEREALLLVSSWAGNNVLGRGDILCCGL